MAKAKRVRNTRPTTSPTGPELGLSEVAELYRPTGITPEEVFVAIGQLRKEAQDEIDRLLAFLDATDGDADFEDDDTEEDSDTEDDGDCEPSLGSVSPVLTWVDRPSDQTKWAQGDCTDLEDEHDGREPDVDAEPSLCGLNVGTDGFGDDREADNADDEPTLGSFDRMVDQTKSWRQQRVWLADGELDPTQDQSDRPQAAGRAIR